MKLTLALLNKSQSGVLFALACAIGLGGITTQAKLFYAEGGNAITLMLVRFVISTLLFALLLQVKQQSFKLPSALTRPVLAIGAFWSGAMICYLLSIESISVSLAVLILYTYPLLVLTYSVINRQLELSIPLIALFGSSFFGLYLALSGGEITLATYGIVFALLGSIGSAYTFIKGARIAQNLSPIVLTFWVNVIGLTMIIPLAFGRISMSLSTKGITALALATLLYVVAVLCQFQALARLRAASAAFILNLEPVVSILLAVFILNEYLALSQWIGVIVVISSLLAAIQFNISRSAAHSET